MAAELRLEAGPSGKLPARLRMLWQHGDQLFRVVIILAALSVFVLVFMMGYELWRNSALSRQAFGWSFLWTSNWDPALHKVFGALPFIQGTLVTSLVALLIAVPVGLGIATFLVEVSPSWLRQP